MTDIEKQNAISDAAFHVFAAHGYRGTSMQMIAARAGMSRPALYLHFQNKEDVFRFLTKRFFDLAAAEADLVFAQSLPPEQTLAQVFAAFDPGGAMQVLLDAKHGHELLDAKASIANDIVTSAVAQLQSGLAAWLAREAAAQRLDCTAPEVSAETILSAYFGLKSPPPSYRSYQAKVAQLATLLGKGLRS